MASNKLQLIVVKYIKQLKTFQVHDKMELKASHSEVSCIKMVTLLIHLMTLFTLTHT